MENSFRSPKNKYRIEIHFSKPLNGIGNVTSITANEIEAASNHIKLFTDQAHRIKATCLISIWENLKSYPEFDWKKIKSYEV